MAFNSANHPMDQNGLLYLLQLLAGKFVAQESGKGLSTEDFTSELKSKLDAIASGAQVNVLEGVKLNGTALAIADKMVDIPVMTGAAANAAGAVGAVPAPAAGEQAYFLRGDGTWAVTPDENTTYTLVQNSENLYQFTFTGTDGYTATIEIPNSNADIANLQAAINTLNGGDTVTGSVAKAVKDAVDGLVDGATKYDTIGELEDAVVALEDTMSTVNGDNTVEGSFRKAVADEAAARGAADTALGGRVTTLETAMPNKAPLDSPALTGTPTAPTATAGTNTTQIATTEFVQTAVAQGVASADHLKRVAVNELPTSGQQDNVIYMIPNPSPESNNTRIEYMWLDGAWEVVGEWKTDLSAYATKAHVADNYVAKADVSYMTNNEIDTIFNQVFNPGA